MNTFEGRTIWVTGAGGLIGSHLARVAKEYFPGAKVAGLQRSDLELLDFSSVERKFKEESPAVVFHCAAMSRGPDCEASPAKARQCNVEVTRVLAHLCGGEGVLAFLSTDQVFDGRMPPYNEAAAVRPLSVYAETKANAEELVLPGSRNVVIRTSLNGGASPTGDRGFDEQMRKAWEAGRELSLFTDEFRCPIHAEETARVACELVMRGCSGIYHVAGPERMSRWDLGRLVARLWPECKPRMRPESVKQFSGPPRAPDLTLDCRKAIEALGRPIQGYREWAEG